ncbi:MAG: N-acetylglucosamine kinase [Anaerolineae bacterium]
MKYVLGVDQGHTQTRAAVCDIDGNILGVGKTYGACHSMHGMTTAMNAIQEASQTALSQAGIQAGDIAILFCGLTGADWPDDYELLEANVLSLGLCENVQVKNDSIVALRGGTWADYGAIVVAGTGGNCAIRSSKGEEFIYHFYHDRDLQGGIALGRRALDAIYRAETGREPATLLTSKVLDMFGLATVDQLLRADVEHRLSLDDIKYIAPLVFQAACEGDRVSCAIIKAFGEGLAELVTAGLKRFNMTGLDVEVVLSGSIFKGPGTLLEEVMTAHIHMVAPKARLVNARYEPVVGAMLLGLEELGVRADQSVQDHIEETSRKLALIRIQR